MLLRDGERLCKSLQQTACPEDNPQTQTRRGSQVTSTHPAAKRRCIKALGLRPARRKNSEAGPIRRTRHSYRCISDGQPTRLSVRGHRLDAYLISLWTFELTRASEHFSTLAYGGERDWTRDFGASGRRISLHKHHAVSPPPHFLHRNRCHVMTHT